MIDKIAVKIAAKCNSVDDLQKYTIRELAEFYNYYGKKYFNARPIKKFENKEKAVKRCSIVFKECKKRKDKNIKQSKRMSVSKFISQLILQGRNATDIIDLVRAHYPESRSTEKDVAWIRFKLRQEGRTIPNSHYKRKK